MCALSSVFACQLLFVNPALVTHIRFIYYEFVGVFFWFNVSCFVAYICFSIVGVYFVTFGFFSQYKRLSYYLR